LSCQRAARRERRDFSALFPLSLSCVRESRTDGKFQSAFPYAEEISGGGRMKKSWIGRTGRNDFHRRRSS